MSTYRFAPIAGATVTQSATTSSAATKIGGQPKQGAFAVRVYNAGTTLAYIEFGGSSVTATSSSIPIPPGVAQIFTMSNPANGGDLYFACIMASSTATISVTPGYGI